MQLKCDESMAKHKPIKFLFHLQRENRPYKPYETLYGNCNKNCKNCICAMFPVDRGSKIEWEHMHTDTLKQGSAQMSVTMVWMRYGQ